MFSSLTLLCSIFNEFNIWVASSATPGATKTTCLAEEHRYNFRRFFEDSLPKLGPAEASLGFGGFFQDKKSLLVPAESPRIGLAFLFLPVGMVKWKTCCLL
jgi:hypothetical protein